MIEKESDIILPHILRGYKFEEIKSGYLNTLTQEQKDMLQKLWLMTLRYFSEPHQNERPTTTELKGIAAKQNYSETEPSELASRAMESPLCRELLIKAPLEDLDCLLLRFLRARKWVLSDAFAMLMDTLRWRLDYGVRFLAVEGEHRIPLALRSKCKAFFWGEDKQDRVLAYIRVGRHDRRAFSVSTHSEHIINIVETCRQMRKWDEQAISLVFDLSELKMASLDPPFTQFVVNCLQSYYPEVLGSVYVVDAPWIFWGFWKIISPLLDPVVASKVTFVNRTDLHQYIDLDMLPIEFCGKCTFQYHYHEPQMLPISDQELYGDPQIVKELSQMERDFLSLTVTADSSGNGEQERERLKQKIRLLRYQVELPRLQDHEYYRLGIIDDRGIISWERAIPMDVAPEAFLPRPNAEGRCSAPPGSSNQ